MKRLNIVVAISIVVIVLASGGIVSEGGLIQTSNVSGNGSEIPLNQTQIGDILANPATYEGKFVTIEGEYRGWQGEGYEPPVTRSDWVIRDETGLIYVTGKSPKRDPQKDIGKRLRVSGIVRIKDNIPYIEAKVLAVDKNKISDQLLSVIEKEPNSTVEVIIETTFDVAPMMIQALIDGHHAKAKQIEEDKLQVIVLALQILSISEYEWLKSIKLATVNHVSDSKIGIFLENKIYTSPDEIVPVIVFSYESPTQEMITFLQYVNASNISLEPKNGKSPKFIICDINAENVLELVKQPWVKKVVYDIVMTAATSMDDVGVSSLNIDEKEAVSIAKQAFIGDYGLDPAQEITILDTGVYHSSFTEKKWWVIKLTDRKVGDIYTVTIDDGAVSCGWDAVETYEQEQAAIVGKISPLLSSELSKTSPEEINVIIVLREQPKIREIVKGCEGKVSEELNAALSNGDKEKTKKIISAIRENVTSQAKQFCIEHGQDTVCNKLESLNAEIIYRGKLRNHVIANIPVSALEELEQLQEVQTIEPDLMGTEHLDVSTKAINADDVWPHVQGNTHTSSAGVLNEVSIFDSGIDCSHPALTCSGSWNYVSSHESTTDDLDGHGTHVAGIVASQDSTYKGVAPGVYLLNEKVAYKTNGDASAPSSAVIQALEHSYNYLSEIVQYSYGWYPPSTGDDYFAWTQGNTELSKTFDAYVEAGLTCTISAGNEGSSYYTITVPGDAFNVITTGNFNDHNTVSRSDDDVRWSSSRGYTGDGRTKPDVAAPGTYIKSTNAFWETLPDFIEATGTSMAAPHVAGIAALEIDEWARLYSERLSGMYFVYGGPLAIRAMIYNSADETTGEHSGSQNDRISGTGYVDAYQAWLQATKNKVKIIPLEDTGDAYYSINVNPGDTIKATIAWNRHVDLSPITPKTVSDIDLKLLDLSGTVLASSNDAQTNWEKLAYTYTGASPTTLRIRVYAWNVPSDVGTETIALAINKEVLSFVYSGPTWLQGELYQSSYPLAGDWNGDVKTDLAVYYPGDGNWEVALSTGSNFVYSGPTWLHGELYQSSYPLTGDWNGDGKTDIAVYYPSDGNWEGALSTGSNFVYSGPTWLHGELYESSYPLAGDWNGDGKTDIAVYYPGDGNWEVALSTGSDFVYSGPTWLHGELYESSYPLAGDWNGDGKTDLAVYYPGDGNWEVALSTGSNFVYSGPTWLHGALYQSSYPLTGDWNCDGKTDVAAYYPADGNCEVALSTGSNFVYSGQFLEHELYQSFYLLTGEWDGGFISSCGFDLAAYYPADGNWEVALSTCYYCI